jgi:hypothetical protein
MGHLVREKNAYQCKQGQSSHVHEDEQPHQTRCMSKSHRQEAKREHNDEQAIYNCVQKRHFFFLPHHSASYS